MSMSEPAGKYSITMPRDIAEAARARSGPSGLSAYVAAAVARQIERDNLNELIAMTEAEHGPVTEDEHGPVTEEEISARRDQLRRAREDQRRSRPGAAQDDIMGKCARRFSRPSTEGRMAGVVLFHHAQGLTPGVVAFADELRRAGHTVHTPDLFDGRTFPTIEQGMAYAGEIGFPDGVIERGSRAVAELPAELVYGGFSLGVLPAQKLAQTRPGALGALLFYSCVPVSEFGPAWPAGVPVQVHGMDADPFFAGEGDIDAARALIDQARDGELFLYPGDQHYFADSSLPSYDPAATALLTQRVLAFLGAR
jgi:dienelactone hydrolase